MASPERGGIIEGYKNVNVITRNVALAVGGIAFFLGHMGVAAVAGIAAAIDQGQIMLIDWWKQRAKKKGTTVTQFPTRQQELEAA